MAEQRCERACYARICHVMVMEFSRNDGVVDQIVQVFGKFRFVFLDRLR